MNFLTKYSQAILGILRIVVGAQFMEHGLSKIAGSPWRRAATPWC